MRKGYLSEPTKFLSQYISNWNVNRSTDALHYSERDGGPHYPERGSGSHYPETDSGPAFVRHRQNRRSPTHNAVRGRERSHAASLHRNRARSPTSLNRPLQNSTRVYKCFIVYCPQHSPRNLWIYLHMQNLKRGRELLEHERSSQNSRMRSDPRDRVISRTGGRESIKGSFFLLKTISCELSCLLTQT